MVLEKVALLFAYRQALCYSMFLCTVMYPSYLCLLFMFLGKMISCGAGSNYTNWKSDYWSNKLFHGVKKLRTWTFEPSLIKMFDYNNEIDMIIRWKIIFRSKSKLSRLIGALFMSRIDYELLFKISDYPLYCDKMRLVDWWIILYVQIFSAFYTMITLYLRITIIINDQDCSTHNKFMNLWQINLN